MIDAGTSYMTSAQHERAEALRVAREVLSNRTMGGSNAVDAVDLHNIASYIVTGKDPWPPSSNDEPDLRTWGGESAEHSAAIVDDNLRRAGSQGLGGGPVVEGAHP